MRFAVFDVETRIDKAMVRTVYFPHEGISEEEAYRLVRERLLRERQSDFFPLAFHIPVSIAVGHVSEARALEAVETLGQGDYSEEGIVREFWQRVERFPGVLVSFNGRNFDLPVLELQALRYGCPAPRYFNEKHGHRYRYSEEGHYDLYDFLTNNGMYHIRGGFNLLARLIGLPGKEEMDGSQVQRLWEEGRLEEIHAYCRRDVVQTYFLFLRIELMRGRLDPDHYRWVLERTAPLRQELGFA